MGKFLLFLIFLSFLTISCGDSPASPDVKECEKECSVVEVCNTNNGKCELPIGKCNSNDDCNGDVDFCNSNNECIKIEVCKATSCTDIHKSQCSVEDGKIKCACDDGYRGLNCDYCAINFHEVNGECVANEVCSENSCTSGHKTVCNVINGLISCSCEDNYEGTNCSECVNGYHHDLENDGDCVVDTPDACTVNPCVDNTDHKTTCNLSVEN